jgi:hypothetical protein
MIEKMVIRTLPEILNSFLLGFLNYTFNNQFLNHYSI